MTESERLLGAIRRDHWELSNDEIAELHAALLAADQASSIGDAPGRVSGSVVAVHREAAKRLRGEVDATADGLI